VSDDQLFAAIDALKKWQADMHRLCDQYEQDSISRQQFDMQFMLLTDEYPQLVKRLIAAGIDVLYPEEASWRDIFELLDEIAKCHVSKHVV